MGAVVVLVVEPQGWSPPPGGWIIPPMMSPNFIPCEQIRKILSVSYVAIHPNEHYRSDKMKQ